MTAIELRTAATGSPVVALHASASGSGQWNGLVSDLDGRFDVHTSNLPGYPKAPIRPTNVKGMAALAKPTISQIETLGCPVHLVGHSFGGGVALKIALTRPDLVKSLTLYEPAAFHILKDRSKADRQLLAVLIEIGELLKQSMGADGSDAGMKAFIDFWNGDGAWKQMPDGMRERLAEASSQVSDDFGNVLSESWMLDDLASLSIPTLMMMGMDSPSVAQKTASLVAENIPNAELALLPGLGHMAPIQNAQWVNPRILQHIARAERSIQTVSWPHQAAA